MSSQNQIKRRKWALPLLLLAMLPGIHGAARATGHEYGSGVLLGRWGGFESGTEIDSVNRSEGQEGKWSKQNNDFSAFGLSTARVRSGSRALVVHSDSYWFDDGVYSPLYSVGAGERMVVQYYRLVTANTGRARNKTGIKMDADVIMSDSHTNPDSTEVWQKVTWYVSTPETTSGDKYVETRHLGRTSMFHSSEPMYIDDLAVYVLRPDEDGVDTTPPNAPTGFHASATNSDSMTITWTAPVGGLDGGAYMLVYGRSDPSTAPNVNGIYTTNNTIGSGTVIYVGGATALNISNLDPATRYYYRLYAFDKAFNYSSAATLNVQTTADGTLAQALDTFYMDWLPINGGAAGEPYYQTVESRDGEDAAQTGSILAGSTGWSGFYTEVEAPGTVYFWWRTSSHASHYLSFFTNYNWSSPMGEISGITDWALTNFLIGGAGTVELDWEYWKNTGDSGGENCGWVDQVFYAEGIGDLNDALDNTDLTFTASGDSIWVYQEQESSDDTAAARSLPIGNSQSVSLDTTLTGPGLLEFQWKVSSEFGYDFLELRDQPAGYASPATVFRMSGERDWTPVVMYITPGEHDMSWRYVKDASISAGYDAGWVDQVKYTRHTLPIIEGFNAASMPDGWTEEPVVMLPDIDFVATSDWPDATPHEGDRFLR